MADNVTGTVNVVETALWPQGDARDPLGVWGARTVLVGDASGGIIKAFIQVAQDRRRSRIYTAYSAQVSVVDASLNAATLVKLRLLTNWPDIDEVNPGVQGFGTFKYARIQVPANTTAPGRGALDPLLNPQDRFILLFDPGVVDASNPMVIMEMELDANSDGADFAFEAYGYYWDRGVLSTPGGPRHPGSN